jgi:hypothetical protein
MVNRQLLDTDMTNGSGQRLRTYYAINRSIIDPATASPLHGYWTFQGTTENLGYLASHQGPQKRSSDTPQDAEYGQAADQPPPSAMTPARDWWRDLWHARKDPDWSPYRNCSRTHAKAL